MDYNIDEIRDNLFRAMDSNDKYSIEEFHSEYGNVSTTAYEENSEIFKNQVKFVNKSNNSDPSYATEGSAGFDLRANESLTLLPGNYNVIRTGLYFELPPNLEMQIRPRSGLAAKLGVTVLNSPGTIDSDYRGEICVILINHGTEEFTISMGDRIAQAVIATVNAKQTIKFNKVLDLNNNTERGESGFGSTGIK